MNVFLVNYLWIIYCRGRVSRPVCTNFGQIGTGNPSPTVKYGNYKCIFTEYLLYIYSLKYRANNNIIY